MDPVTAISNAIAQGFGLFSSFNDRKVQELAGQQQIDVLLFEQQRQESQARQLGLLIGALVLVSLTLILIFKKK